MIRGDRSELDRRAATEVADVLRRRLDTAPTATLGVVGGRSVGGIYDHLREASLAWDRVHVFLADERLVPRDSPESNFRLVDGDLLGPLRARGSLPEANAHPFPYTPETADEGVAAYDRELDALGGRFDVAVLSAGEDGHTASLFPDHPSVESDAAGFVVVEASPKPPPRRVSASRALLARTGFGVLVLYGESKRPALEAFLDPAVDVTACPCKVVQDLSDRLVLTDLA